MINKSGTDEMIPPHNKTKSGINNNSSTAPLSSTIDTENEPGILNKIFRRRSSLGSRKSDERRESLVDHLTSFHNNNNSSNNNNNTKQESRKNSNTNPCYRLSFQVGVSENKNTKYRPTMEDVHTYVANFAERLDWGYFAVFDGHAGKQALRWCGSNLHSVIEKNILRNDNMDLRINLNNSFVEGDDLIRDDCNGSSGCTAAVAILRWEEVDQGTHSNSAPSKKSSSSSSSSASSPSSSTSLPSTSKTLRNRSSSSSIDPHGTPFDFIPTANHRRMLYTANVGDSRLVLSRKGTAVRLSYDHKGSDESEQDRIVKSGGVILKSRVNGMLAVTRSLGDIYMKDLVIGNPYTTATEITEQDEFLIIACDGLWDVCSDQHAIEMIRDVRDVNRAAKLLCDYAMENLTTDNVTVMVVRFDEDVFKYKQGHHPVVEEDDEELITDDGEDSNVSDSEKVLKSGKQLDDYEKVQVQAGELDTKIESLSVKD